jgi:hypothetical protein
LLDGDLYHQIIRWVALECLGSDESKLAISEVHDGICIEMAMGTRDLVDFSSIRRRVWTEFCIRGFVSGTNVVPNGFVGPGLVFLNPELLPVYSDQNC